MYTRGVVLVVAVVALFLSSDLFAGQAGGGRGGMRGGGAGGGARGGAGMRGNDGNGQNRRDGEMEDERNVDFQSSLSDAEAFAENKDVPVMAFIGDGSLNDKKWTERLSSWPQLQEMSRTKLAVVQLSEKEGAGKEIAQGLKLRAPSLAFLDKYGNAMLGMSFPDSVGPISNVVAGWKGMMSNVESFFKDHTTRGERLLNSGKIKTAYLEFELVAPFKGPEPTKAKTNMKKIEDQWLRLLEIGSRMPAGTAQNAIYKGLRKDTLGTSYAASMELYLKDPNAAVAARNGNGAPMVTAPAKSLTEATRGSVSSAASNDSSEDANSGLDTGVLSKSSDDRLKKADVLLKEGVTDYKKATAESMERGPVRNELLQAARTKFEQVLNLCEEAQKAGAGQGLDKIMEKTSMLMYGALKYQSL